MKRGITALLTAVFLAGVGTAQAALEADQVINGGFDGLSGSDPGMTTINASGETLDAVGEWFIVGPNDTFGIVSETAVFGVSSPSVRWKYAWGVGHTIQQKLGVVVTAGEPYEVNLSHAIGYSSGKPNDAQFEASIWTSPTVDGVYAKAVGLGSVYSTNAPNTFASYVGTFSAASLAAYVGEYMQLRVERTATGVDYNLLIDDVALYGPMSDEGTLIVNPTGGLPLQFFDATAVVSNNIDLSYTEGGLGSNMVVSSIAIIDASVAGFSVSPSSITLTDPTPATEQVWVEFDNVTAGLPANSTASANVEIIWNDASSSTSATSTVPVNVTYFGAHAGNIIAAFYSEQNAWKNANAGYLGEADIAMPDVDTSVSGIEWATNKRGSDDTSYGTQLGNAPVSGGAAQGSYGNYNDNKILIAITNNSVAAIELESVNFDYGRAWGADSADYVTVTIDGDLDLGGFVVLTNVYGTVQTGDNVVDLNDCDVDLTGLADPYLEVGEVVTFEFQLNMTGDIGILDNVAVLGKGTLPAIVSRVLSIDAAGWAVLGVTGLEDSSVSQMVDLIFQEGELMTNVVITGVSISNLLDSTGLALSSGMSAVGAFPVALTTPGVTNSAVFDLVFDNTVANLEPGVYTEHLVIIEYDEVGRGPLTSEFYAYGLRPDDVPTNGVLALFDTELLVPDAAYTGILGAFISGRHENSPNLPGKGKGSLDNTYGTLLTSRGEGTNDTWCILMNGESHLQEASLVITNTTTAAIELSELRFDMGRWYEADPNFSLDVSGDVTAANLLTDEPTTLLGWNNHDFDDHDITLTNLTDHTLAAGESVTFTWTYEYQGADIYIAMFIDNVALMGTVDHFGGWSASEGLAAGVNDDPYDNPDNDGKDNLTEYATGGDPLVADGSNASSWLSEDGGTNWLYYVHSERQDDAGLTYTVGTKENLQYDPSWDAGAVEEMGRANGSGLWKTVTNRTDMSSAAEFIGLTVEQN